MKLNDRVAAVGVGYSTTGRKTGLTSWQLAIQASKAAMADAGLSPDDIDGVSLLWGVAGTGPEVSTRSTRWTSDICWESKG